jgi:large subunit ribosomal protein L18
VRSARRPFAHEAAHGFDAAAMAAMYKRLPMAEKNLLKIFASNKYISLQVVNNRTGHIFLWANTMEKALRESLQNTWDKTAARAAAGLLARRAREANQQQLTFERGKKRYTGKVKLVLDTLQEHGIEFVERAGKAPPRFPWERTAPPAGPPAGPPARPPAAGA